MAGKFRDHTRRHKTFYRMCVVLLAFVIIAGSLNYYALLNQSQTYSTQSLEKQALTELDVYHEGSVRLATASYQQSLEIISDFAKNPAFVSALSAGNRSYLAETIQTQRLTNKHFATIAVFDSRGTLLARSSEVSGAAAQVGQNFSQRPTVMALLKAKHAFIVGAHQTLLGQNVVSFGAPVMNSAGQMIGGVTGSITLADLSTQIDLTSSYQSFGSVLLDSSGDLLLSNNQPAKSVTSIANDEPVFSQVKDSTSAVTTEEYNFQDKPVFAEASRLDFDNAGSAYLISYYYKDSYQAQLASQRQAVRNIFSGFILRDALLLGLAIVALAYILSRHEQK